MGLIYVKGYVILNHFGNILTRKKYETKGKIRHKYFLQRVFVTTIDRSIPLSYPEVMLFPSIYWIMADTV